MVEALNAVASIVTLVIIATSAVAALIGVRHAQAGNGLKALLSIVQEFRSAAVQDSLRYVQRDLSERLEQSGYRAELIEIGFIDPSEHPEVTACNWFDEIGNVVKQQMVGEDAFMDLFARMVNHYWLLLAPAIALMRRRRGASQYHNFEFLAIRARRWVEKHPGGIFPRGTPRAVLPDPWLAADAAGTAEYGRAGDFVPHVKHARS